MINLSLSVDKIDYSSLIPVLVPMVIKNKLAAKAAQFTIEAKLKTMSEQEKNAFVVNFLHEHKNQIIENLNEFVKDKGIKGFICNFDADIL